MPSIPLDASQDILQALGRCVSVCVFEFRRETLVGEHWGNRGVPRLPPVELSSVRRASRRRLCATMDELSAPLDILAPPPPLHRRLLKIMLIIAVLPLLPLLLMLLPCVALAVVPALALFRPTILRGLPRDVRFVIRLVRATRQLNQRLAQSRGTFTTADYWAETVQKHSAKTALIFGERTYTYAQVDAESDRIAQWALDQRLAPGDGVALLCANRPEHLFCWLVRLDSKWGHSLNTSGHAFTA